MPVRKSKSIFGIGETNYEDDADIIMTAAVLGYSLGRLNSGKNCAFAAEAISGKAESSHLTLPPIVGDYNDFKDKSAKEFEKYNATRGSFAKQEFEAAEGWILLTNAIARINAAIRNSLKQTEPREVLVDATPNFGDAGVIWIEGGTGDLSLTNQNRYIHSPIYSNRCGQLIYEIEKKKIDRLYKGVGAYTGFSARETGEPGVFSTFRGHPSNEFGERWIAPDLKENTTCWGQIPGMEQGAMVYRDDQQTSNAYEQLVDGYTHGMIQAIYDVVQFRSGDTTIDPGNPFEIGLDSTTTKLASCFLCGLFMEANKFPASSIHLGANNSWAPNYLSDDRNLQKALLNCNDIWSNYCRVILEQGILCLDTVQLSLQHQNSLLALKQYLSTARQKNISANLILDAATVFGKQVVRIVRTIPFIA